MEDLYECEEGWFTTNERINLKAVGLNEQSGGNKAILFITDFQFTDDIQIQYRHMKWNEA